MNKKEYLKGYIKGTQLIKNAADYSYYAPGQSALRGGAIGAGLGAALGGTIGYFSEDDKKQKWRTALQSALASALMSGAGSAALSAGNAFVNNSNTLDRLRKDIAKLPAQQQANQIKL